ncbi:chemotaxis protein CheA [Clostridium sp. PL3]|uniref:Chemotaxis protein CheA n=1 Tax=Clostridium thailandense TaxID=2794346 RepID=A0A949WQZ4_9CLOT|nr:chemotaxis protein CheA [Clostridium thailandense]MBV7273366.1 chemotaxis protein CheA [Clostridium thailandense]
MSSVYESSEMIRAFLDEVEEQLQFLEEGILELEETGESQEVVQEIFRVAHTLKGSSSTMGYDKMKDLTHEMENVLDKIRNNLLTVDRTIINSLFKCLDCLRLLKDDFAQNKNSTKIDISNLVEELKGVLGIKPSKKTAESKSEETEIKKTSGEDILVQGMFNLVDKDKNILERAILEGDNCIVCKVKIAEESLMKATRACLILNTLNEMGSVIASRPNVFELPDDSEVTLINYLITTDLDIKELESKAKDELMDVEEVRATPFKLDVSEKDRKVEVDNAEDGLSRSKVEHNEKRISQTVRVDIERLEQMMNLVGEMVIEQTRIAQVGSILHNRYIKDSTVDDLMGISNHVSRVVSELQESVMKARMLPVQQLFNRFPRVVRDLSQSLGKEVELILEGGDTEMDRTIIEDITDPLIHLVRNSLDHGIETTEIREGKGKPSKGFLKIRAFHQENHVIITIEDDGAGLDLEKIKKSAIKKNVVSAQMAETLSQSEVVNLIFETGLSTAENVSDVSGRGVGMDIVRNHIDKLNGMIYVETKEGEGTKFTIKLPLTLAILTGLLVKIHNETYALPMSNIVEIVRKPVSEIESVKKQSIVIIRDKVLPLIWLHDYFKLPRMKSKKNIFIVILGTAEKRFGVVVDKLIGNQEIVVKPLGAYIGKVEGISGATILGDGSVACILDVLGLSRIINSKVIRENIGLKTESNNNDTIIKNNEITEAI